MQSLAQRWLYLAASTCIVVCEDQELQIDHISGPESCDSPAKEGDVVGIFHVGYVHNIPRGKAVGRFAQVYEGQLMDQNIAGEPLKIRLGTQSTLRGMDWAIQGMCKGQKISVVIPPELAFNDPKLKGNAEKLPVPRSATVRYEIELAEIYFQSDETPSELPEIPETAGSNSKWILSLVLLGVVYESFSYFVTRGPKSSSGRGAAKERKRDAKGEKKRWGVQPVLGIPFPESLSQCSVQ